MSTPAPTPARAMLRRTFTRAALCLGGLIASRPLLAQTSEAAPRVVLETNLGTIVLELAPEHAPKTVANFLRYVNEGHYNGTIFHRVIPNFMAQAGGFDAQLREKPTRPPVAHEGRQALQAGLRNQIGTIAMARTNDPQSATAQFFINVADNDFLNFKSETPQGWGYAVFGKVSDGMDTVNKIKAVKTGTSGFHQDVPKEDVVIQSVTVK